MTTTLFIKESPLLVYPTLAKKIGLNEAIVLHQVHYWLNPKMNKNCFNEKLWVRNSYKQWQRQFPFWTIRTIRRIFADLETHGLLLSYRTMGFQTTKYYTINYEKLSHLAGHPYGQNDHPSGQIDLTYGQLDHTPMDKLATPYIEAENTYTENTHKNTHLPPSANFSMKEEEEKFLKKLIDIWNAQIQATLHPSGLQVQLTQQRSQQLLQLLEHLLNNDPEQWEAYCTKISQCRYLMGNNPSGFKVTFDWALKPENAFKVLEGVFYDKPQESRSKELRWPDYEFNLKQHCKEQQYPEGWLEVCQRLVRAFGQATFESWFKALTPVDVTGGNAVLRVESNFIREYIQANFQWDLLVVLQSVYPHTTRCEIQTKGKLQC